MEIKDFKFKALQCNKAYAVIDGKLQSVKVNAILFDIQNYTSSHQVILPDGKMAWLDNDAKLYATQEDYENGKPLVGMSYSTYDLLGRVGLKCDGNKPYSWQMIDGDAVQIYPTIDTIALYLENGYEWVAYIGSEKLAFPYESREICLQMNDYTVVEEDGTKRVVRGNLKKLIPTETQRKFIEAIKTAVKNASDAGVGIVWNSEYEAISFVNKDEMEWSQGNDCMTYKKNEGGFFVTDAMIRSIPEFDSYGMFDYWVNCDYGIDIKFKQS